MMNCPHAGLAIFMSETMEVQGDDTALRVAVVEVVGCVPSDLQSFGFCRECAQKCARNLTEKCMENSVESRRLSAYKSAACEK